MGGLIRLRLNCSHAGRISTCILSAKRLRQSAACFWPSVNRGQDDGKRVSNALGSGLTMSWTCCPSRSSMASMRSLSSKMSHISLEEGRTRHTRKTQAVSEEQHVPQQFNSSIPCLQEERGPCVGASFLLPSSRKKREMFY